MKKTLIKTTILLSFIINSIQAEENEIIKHLELGEKFKNKKHGEEQIQNEKIEKPRQNFFFKKGRNLDSNFISNRNASHRSLGFRR